MRTFFLAAVAAVVLVPGCYRWQAQSGNASRTRSAPATAAFTVDCDRQADRQALIRRITNDGVIHRTDRPGSIPRLYVSSSYYALSYEDKGRVASVVFSWWYCEDDATDMLVLRDHYSGNDVGTYSPDRGLEMN